VRSRGDTLALLLGGAYVLSALALPAARERLLELTLLHPLPRLLALIGVVPPALAVVVYRLRAGGPAEEGWRRGIAAAREHGWLGERLVRYLIVAIGLTFFFWAFAAWKTHIPPFTMDPVLAQWDRRLHGADPYRLFSFGYRPWVTDALATAYYDWRYVLLGLVLWQGWSRPGSGRGQFWLAFVLCWILLGTVLATLVPSAGPCFYQVATGQPGPYAPLMAYLTRVAPPGVFETQRGLWTAVANRIVVVGGGVSAFPSLHVALPLLGACVAWPKVRGLAWAFIGYAIVLWIGTVHLGWHYAVDGEASALLVYPIWRVSGCLAMDRANRTITPSGQVG
jgi:hypothetical protein